MYESLRCSDCGGRDVVDGHLASRLNLGFRPRQAPRFGTAHPNTPVYACMCMDCGAIRLQGDRRWVAKVIGRPLLA